MRLCTAIKTAVQNLSEGFKVITKISNGKIILPDGIVEKNLYIEDGIIKSITDENLPFDELFDAKQFFCKNYSD